MIPKKVGRAIKSLIFLLFLKSKINEKIDIQQ